MSRSALPWNFTVKNETATTATLDIEGVIGWDVTFESFRAQMKAFGTRDLTINLNSPGGDVLAGLDIYDLIEALPGTVTINVLGSAMSMGSVIILAGDVRTITPNGRIMVHRVDAGIRGNPDQLEAGAKVARALEDRIIAIYRAKLGWPEQKIRDAMNTEIGTWFHGNEAVTAGFVHRVATDAATAKFKGEWANLFTYLPAALFDNRATDMADNITPAAEIEPVDPPVVAPPAVEPGSPVEEQPTEIIPAAPVEPTAPEAKGFFDRILAAVSGDAALKNELSTARAALATREGEIAALQTQLTAAQAKATQFDALVAQVTQLEAAAKTTGQAAAEIAASHGLKPEQLAALPPPGEAVGSLLDQFNAITDPAERQRFYKQHSAALRKALFKK